MTKHLVALFMGSSLTLVVFAGSPGAGADEVGNSATQQSFQSRIDQLAQPAAPKTGEQPGNPPATAPSPGSFPRSFLIPGTDTSISISGSVGGTMGYYGH